MLHCMPIRVAVRCAQCERIYVLAHADTAKRIRRTPRSDLRSVYCLRCTHCNVDQYFDQAQILPYRVSDLAVIRGFAERNHYDAVPNRRPDGSPTHSTTGNRRNSPHRSSPRVARGM